MKTTTLIIEKAGVAEDHQEKRFFLAIINKYKCNITLK